jgi:hypothetical protein
MYDSVNTVEGAPYGRQIAQITDNELGVRVQIRGPLALGMHLRVQNIKYPDFGARLKEPGRDM